MTEINKRIIVVTPVGSGSVECYIRGEQRQDGTLRVFQLRQQPALRRESAQRLIEKLTVYLYGGAKFENFLAYEACGLYLRKCLPLPEVEAFELQFSLRLPTDGEKTAKLASDEADLFGS